jgi:hypothetical protein
MFIGHYGASFVIKKADNRIPLWLLFFAVQFLDVLWSSFILLGIEKMRIVPGFTASNPFDLYYMPYTHSLIGALFWASVVGLIYFFWKRTDRTTAILLALAVFSHWVLDLIVHQHDLSLYDDTLKMGFGLWNFPIVSLLLEIFFLIGSTLFYLYKNDNVNDSQRKKIMVFVTVLIAIGFVNLTLPPSSSPAIFAIESLGSYIIFTATLFWIEKTSIKTHSR